MICPYCGSKQSLVTDSRQTGAYRDRWLRCISCDKRYRTQERVVSSTRKKQLRPELWSAAEALRSEAYTLLRELTAQEEDMGW